MSRYYRLYELPALVGLQPGTINSYMSFKAFPRPAKTEPSQAGRPHGLWSEEQIQEWLVERERRLTERAHAMRERRRLNGIKRRERRLAGLLEEIADLRAPITAEK